MSGIDDTRARLLAPLAPSAASPDQQLQPAMAGDDSVRKIRFASTRAALELWRTRIGLFITLGILAIAIFGPFVAPHSPTSFVAAPYTHASSALPLGADGLGRDALSRVLHGGLSILVLSAIATALGVGIGTLL